MNHPESVLLRIGLLAAALVSLPVSAQELGFSKDLKVRTGYGFVTQDKLRASFLGFGLNFSYGLPAGKLGLELGYFYKTGDQFIKDPTGAAPDDLTALNPDLWGDSRRNQLDGFSVRLSFQKPFSDEWGWQAGLMIGGTRFKHEYVGDQQSLDWTADNPGSWRDTYSGTPVKGGARVSPFAGVYFTLTDHSSLEVNLLVLNYTALDYVHHPGSGTYALSTVEGSDDSVGRIADNNAFPADTLDQKNRLSTQIEFAYALHF